MVALMRAVAIGLSIMTLVSPAGAADEDWRLYPIRSEIDHPATQRKLDPGVRLYFAGETTPAAIQRTGSVSQLQRGSKTDYYPCTRALTVALKALQEKARAQGGSALVDIVSLDRGRAPVAAGQYACLLGGASVQVEIRGTVARAAGQ